jgi:hypothetical protein
VIRSLHAAEQETQQRQAEGERRLAPLLPASWNQIASWLKQIDKLRQAA